MKRYVIEAVWNDSDFGKVGTVASFTIKANALKRLERLKSHLPQGQAWRYELRDTKKDVVIS